MSFPLVGNSRVKETVLSLFSSNRIPHAILIDGAEGLGKRTLAAFLSRAIACSGEQRPCEVCSSCHLAKVGTHPDIVRVVPESGKKNISVNIIRSLRQQVFVKAHSSDRRVFIIENADSMNEAAQNAFLKILEEPPQGVSFILTAASKTLLLETIVSRCSVLSLSPPPSLEAASFLESKSKKSIEEIKAALSKSGNNIGSALTLLGQRKERPQEAAAKAFIDAVLHRDQYSCISLLAPFEKDRAGTEELFRILKQELVKQIRSDYTNTYTSKTLNEVYEILCEHEKLLKTNINLPLLFSATVCKINQISNL